MKASLCFAIGGIDLHPGGHESASVLAARVESLQRQLGRLELTEVTESTLRETLERERDRADRERERAERLERDLEEARRSWWRRLFGA